MTSNSIIYLTINLADPSLDPEELDEGVHLTLAHTSN